MIDINELSNKYKIKKLTIKDVDDILNLELNNNEYFKYHPPHPNIETIKKDLKALPNNKSYNDKYFIGYYLDKKLIGIADLIDDFPNKKCAFIGFFMLDISYQHKNIGTTIFNDLFLYLKKNNYLKIRLGIDKYNKRAVCFWTKNNFNIIQEKKIDNHFILVAERLI